MSEIFTIADRYTVFRDGGFIETGKLADIDRRHLVRQIVGRELNAGERKERKADGEVVLSVRNFSRKSEFDDISLEVKRGEVLGIYGLIGSGRSEFLNCVFGITRPDSGSAALLGEPIPEGKPGQSIQKGISLVTEDRKATGLVLSSSVAFNTTLARCPTCPLPRISIAQKNAV